MTRTASQADIDALKAHKAAWTDAQVREGIMRHTLANTQQRHKAATDASAALTKKAQDGTLSSGDVAKARNDLTDPADMMAIEEQALADLVKASKDAENTLYRLLLRLGEKRIAELQERERRADECVTEARTALQQAQDEHQAARNVYHTLSIPKLAQFIGISL